MDLRRGFLVWLVLLSGLFFYPERTKAEDLTIYGLPFEIDEIAQVGESTVRLSINGRSVLVPAAEVPYYVLRESNAEGVLKEKTMEQLRLLFDGAIAERDAQSIEIILPLLVFAPEIQSTEVERIFKNLRSIDSNREIFDRFWATDAGRLSTEMQARLILAIVEDGTTAVVSIVPGSDLDIKIGELIEERLKLLLDQGGDCMPMARALAQSFEPNSERSLLVTEACESGVLAQKAAASIDTTSLLSIFNNAKSDLSRNIIEPSLVKALHAKARAELSEGRFIEALSILGDVPQNKISPTTHELILKGLQGSPDLLKDNLIKGAIEGMLLHVVDRSPQLKDAYVAALNRSIQEAIARGDWALVDKGLEYISRHQSDENMKDAIWFEVAIASVKAGENEKALAYLNSLSTKPSFTRKVQFYLHGGYGMRYLLFIIPVFLFFVLQKLRAVWASKKGLQFSDVTVNLSVASETTESKLTPDESRELNKSLYRLGLKPRASEQDIKNAFRERAKIIHPDKINNEGSESSSDEFVELTKAYDLAIKLTQKQLEA